MIQNRKYLPRIKRTPGSGENQVAIYLIIFFFHKSKCLSERCLHSRQPHEFSAIYAVTRTKTIMGNLKPVENWSRILPRDVKSSSTSRRQSGVKQRRKSSKKYNLEN